MLTAIYKNIELDPMTTALQLELSPTAIAAGLSLTGSDGTFTSASNEPFQRWYPYLEGYSSAFVRKVLAATAPSAQTVLDPFGGTGTTGFVAGQLGLDAFVCEVNPVMQFIFETKIAVRRLTLLQRTALVERLNDLVKWFPSQLKHGQADRRLLSAYSACFGNSRFFVPETLLCIARARRALDDVLTADALSGRLLSVACLSSLVPASLLKRAGDLRFRTERELAAGVMRFDVAVMKYLETIISDIATHSDALYLRRAPQLLCSDARLLASLPPLNADVVITSPPYINGTNYFRNARLELWFLRSLRDAADLTRLRQIAVTAGINDVSKSKAVGASHPSVDLIVSRLAEGAYDDRIPRMVASYFGDLRVIFEGLRAHLKPGAPVAIDIGDSNYGGVHVAADELLSHILKDIGFIPKSELVLRSRRSKNGAPLRQVLLIFDNSRESTVQGRRAEPAWKKPWRAFQEGLPHQSAPFASRNWGSELHSLCSYPGKLKPAVAHHLVNTFVPARGKLLDPFAGVGTIPFEASLTGREAFGIELSPAAFPVAAAKLTLPAAVDANKLISELAAYLDQFVPQRHALLEANRFGLNGAIADYFHDETLKEVLGAREFFSQCPESASAWLAMAACLHILHGNRPYALSRKSHPLTPYKPTGPFEYRSLVTRLRAKVNRALQAELPTTFRPGHMFLQDATGWWPAEINDLDAIVTSPPFFDSTRFHVQNWLRLWFAGWSPESFSIERQGFLDERQKQSFTVYDPIFRQAKDRLKRGGVLVMHLGKSRKCDMARELQRVGGRWFRRAEVFDESVAHCESHGMRDKGTVTAHQYLILY